MARFLGLIFFLIAFQGCVTDEGLTGTGPVTLTDRQKTHFQVWARGTTDRDSLYFFLIQGGRSYAVFCPETRAICRDANEYNWKQKCDAKYGAGACRLYGVYGDVVWKTDEPADPTWSNERPGLAVSKEAAATGVDVRSIEIKWDGRPGTLTGSLHYRTTQRRYEINLTIPGETYCDGSAEFTRHTWNMTCRNNVTAQGTFEPLGNGRGSIGKGRDSNGNRIEFRVGPARS